MKNENKQTKYYKRKKHTPETNENKSSFWPIMQSMNVFSFPSLLKRDESNLINQSNQSKHNDCFIID